MSDDKNPVMGVITFGPGQGLRTELRAESVTVVESGELPTIDVRSIMRAAGFDEGLEAAVKKIEDYGESQGLDLDYLVSMIRAMKQKP